MQRWVSILLFLLVLSCSLPVQATEARTLDAAQLVDIDVLLAEGELRQAIHRLQALEEVAGPSVPLLWRRAQAEYELGRSLADEGRVDGHFRQAEELARRAIALDPECDEGFKWLAIALGARAEHADLETQLELSRGVHANIERALALDPADDISHLVLSRWHYKVSSLGFFARTLVNLIYGEMPEASLEKAEDALWTAIHLRDRISHRYYLAKVYDRMGERGQALAQLRLALELPVTFPEERETLDKALAKLEKWGDD